MAVEYLGLSSLNGPLAVLEGVSGASYDEIVEMTVDGKEKKLGRIIEAYEDKAVIQVFESTGNMALKNTHTRLTGHPMEIGVSADMLGRTFDGLGNPIDGLGPILADKKLDVNGKPLNPVAREYPRNYIRTGISAIDGLMTLIRGQKLPIFSGNGLPHDSWQRRSSCSPLWETIPMKSSPSYSQLWASSTMLPNTLNVPSARAAFWTMLPCLSILQMTRSSSV